MVDDHTPRAANQETVVELLADILERSEEPENWLDTERSWFNPHMNEVELGLVGTAARLARNGEIRHLGVVIVTLAQDVTDTIFRSLSRASIQLAHSRDENNSEPGP